jgi:integrase
MQNRTQERTPDYHRGMTVSEYAWRWLARKAADLKPSTRHRYADQLQVICDGLGYIAIAELEPGIVTEWLGALSSRLGDSSRMGLLRVLRTMTRDAKADLRLTHWACERVVGPRQLGGYDDENPNALVADELGRLFIAMRDHEPTWFPLFATMAMTGMRFAEASALQWADVDFDAGKISVRRNQYRGMLSTPKTARSRRAIPVVPELAAILKRHQKVVGETTRGIAWVFPSSAGKPHHSGALSGPLQRAAAIAQVRTHITPHGLRRTLNTLALQVAPAETIRSILGHVTSEMTTRYNAPTLEARREVLSRVTQSIRSPLSASDARRVRR